jgi:hypothetical protein
MRESGNYFVSRLYFGVIVIGLGVLFTLDNLGFVHAREILRWWPVLLMIFGLLHLMGLGRRPSVTVGLIFLLGGGWMLLHEAHLVSMDVWQLWPVLLIVWGISMIRGRSTVWRVGYIPRGEGGVAGVVGERVGERVRERIRERWQEHTRDRTGEGDRPGGPDDKGDPAATFTVDAFLSSVVRKVSAQALTHGAVVTFLGGADVDLRSARMATDRATLEVSMVMGGLNLFVPEDWAVDYQGAQILGSVEDHSKRPVGEPRGRLVITGVVILSSVIIKN